MAKSLHARVKICAVDAHCLLRHCALECVFGGLIMIGKRNDGSAYSKHHRRMNLTVSISISVLHEIALLHSYEGGFFFFNIDVLDKSCFL